MRFVLTVALSARLIPLAGLVQRENISAGGRERERERERENERERERETRWLRANRMQLHKRPPPRTWLVQGMGGCAKRPKKCSKTENTKSGHSDLKSDIDVKLVDDRVGRIEGF